MRFSYISRFTQYISRYTSMGFSSRGSGFQMKKVWCMCRGVGLLRHQLHGTSSAASGAGQKVENGEGLGAGRTWRTARERLSSLSTSALQQAFVPAAATNQK
jgi:hypothetical protein